jgi:hypothetical protein
MGGGRPTNVPVTRRAPIGSLTVRPDLSAGVEQRWSDMAHMKGRDFERAIRLTLDSSTARELLSTGSSGLPC